MEKRIELNGRELVFRTEKVASQADGSCILSYGDTVILSTTCFSRKELPFAGFVPLSCDYRERRYAAGKIPGGFFKREGRPTEKEILSSRLMDRPIRPLLPLNLGREVQVITTVLSHDGENDADTLAVIGGSLSLGLSSVPFSGPIGAVKIGRVAGEFILNPTVGQLAESTLNLTVAGTKKGISTIEASCYELDESLIMDALRIAETEIKKIVEIEEEIILSEGREKFSLSSQGRELEQTVKEAVGESLKDILEISVKNERRKKFELLMKRVLSEVGEENEAAVKHILGELESDIIRESINKGIRLNGRGLSDLREIICKVGVLPRTHGSAIFKRGETEALCTVTLGTMADEQRIEALEGQSFKSFMFHYNFPPFSVGEVRRMFGPARREIGHGALAEKALAPLLPKEEVFAYTIRIVSDILSSNGSSSMASICGSSLALMDAGVPVKCNVAGIAMGLVDGKILTDIAGDEDHCGDMDFKIAGTDSGITALQLDIKKEWIDIKTIEHSLTRAKEARLKILNIMNSTISSPRDDISLYAPRLEVIFVPKEKIGQVIGPGGKIIRGLSEETGAEIEINDDGKVSISGMSKESVELAEKKIKRLVEEVEVGKVYIGKVKRILPFGAFVEILPNKEGMIHISQLAHRRVASVEDEVKVGDEISCKVIGIDEQGRIQLSKKAVDPPDRRGSK